MTYPRCPLELEEVKILLFLVHPTKISDWLIAREKHEDGAYHIHAYLRYEKKITYRMDLWDLHTSSGVFHGNYQKAKSSKAVVAYCSKDGKYIGNIDPRAHLQHKASKNARYLSEDLNKLVDSGELGLQQLPQLYRAKELYRLSQPVSHTDNVKGVWIYGSSGLGKSHFVRLRHPNAFIKDQTKWWTGYVDQEVVILEDFDLKGACLSHHIKIWADKWGAQVESKGGHVILRHRLLVVTSNYSIEAVFGKDDTELLQAIQRRFKEFFLQERTQFASIEY